MLCEHTSPGPLNFKALTRTPWRSLHIHGGVATIQIRCSKELILFMSKNGNDDNSGLREYPLLSKVGVKNILRLRQFDFENDPCPGANFKF